MKRAICSLRMMTGSQPAANAAERHLDNAELRTYSVSVSAGLRPRVMRAYPIPDARGPLFRHRSTLAEIGKAYDAA